MASGVAPLSSPMRAMTPIGRERHQAPRRHRQLPNKADRKKRYHGKNAIYRERNHVGRFNKLKQSGRIATRHDKLGATFCAFIPLEAVRISLRSVEPTAQLAERQVTHVSIKIKSIVLLTLPGYTTSVFGRGSSGNHLLQSSSRHPRGACGTMGSSERLARVPQKWAASPRTR